MLIWFLRRHHVVVKHFRVPTAVVNKLVVYEELYLGLRVDLQNPG